MDDSPEPIPEATLYFDDANPSLKMLKILNDCPAVSKTVRRIQVNGKSSARPSDVHFVPAVRVHSQLLVGRDAFEYIYYRVCQDRSTLRGAVKVIGTVLLITWIVQTAQTRR